MGGDFITLVTAIVTLKDIITPTNNLVPSIQLKHYRGLHAQGHLHGHLYDGMMFIR